jgi:hypothetical protein
MARFGSRRRLRQALGVLWLIDAVLQMQPFMWTRGFGSGTLASAAVDQPIAVAAPVRLAARLVAAHPLPCNACFVLVQLAIGAGLLLARRQRWQRIWCISSLVWALGVWVLGEGLGGVLTGHIGLDIGAPGAALLYAVVTVAAWPSQRPIAPWVLFAWAAVWLTGAVLQLLPAQRTAVGLGSQVDMAAMMSPSVLAGPEAQLASWLADLPAAAAAALALALAAGQAWIGLAVLRRGRHRALALRLGVLLSLVFWVICQGFGGISTSNATDPSSAPLLILLAFSVAGSSLLTARDRRPQFSRSNLTTLERNRDVPLSRA